MNKHSLQILSKAIQFDTSIYDNPSKTNWNNFIQQAEFLQKSFPLFHSILEKETINTYSYLFKWKGRDNLLKPKLFISHQDVVPVPENTMDTWTHGAFSGDIKNDFLYGRGTLDLKVSLVGIMDAVEQLLRMEFQPESDLYFAFGHDEEIGGNDGAKHIVKYLKQQQIFLSAIFDEGMFIMKDGVPGMSTPSALVGVSEKGFASYSIKATAEPGHSAIPNLNGIEKKISHVLNKIHPTTLETKISNPVQLLIASLAKHAPFPIRFLFKNQAVFSKIIQKLFIRSAAGNAMMRSTLSCTIINAGDKENVLANSASVIVNARLIPGDTITSIQKKIQHLVGSDFEVQIHGDWHCNPSKISSVNNSDFLVLKHTIKKIFETAEVIPTLALGTTDSRHYEEITDNTYRFLPIELHQKDLKRIHGVNERISTNGYLKVISFYHELIKQF